MKYAMTNRPTAWMPAVRHRRSQNAGPLVDDAIAALDALMKIPPRLKPVGSGSGCSYGALNTPSSRCADRCDRIGLLDRTACRTIRDVRARKLERPSAVVAAAGVELRGMVREGERVFLEQLFETRARRIEMSLRLFEPVLRFQNVGQ